MTKDEFKKLHVGDVVTLIKGNNKDKFAEVVYIHEDEVVIKCLDEKNGFTIGGKTNSKLHVTKYRELSC